MNRTFTRSTLGCMTLIFSAGATVSADIRISEYMYSGSGGEFIELINIGSQPVDMTGWSYDDDSRTPGLFDLSAFGIVQPGEIVIFTEDPAEVFRADWGLDASIKIIGDLGAPNGNNLGRNDAIVLFDGNGGIVDQLAYGDQNFPGSIRTQNASGWVVPSGVGQDNPFAWVLSSVADAQNSYAATTGELGNPGTFDFDASQLPASIPAVVITEYMYAGPTGEFVEFTNLSDAPVDMTGWAFDDDNFGNGAIGPFDLSAFGTVMPGESVILTEADAETFRTVWGLSASVKIIGNLGQGNGANIGRNDEINIYDANGDLIDRLAYGDQDFPGSIRTQNISGSTTPEFLGANDIFQWSFAAPNDGLGSYVSANGDAGNPGRYYDLCTLDGDANGDGSVDLSDLNLVLANFGQTTSNGDVTGDGEVNLADLNLVLANFGQSCN